MDHVTRLPVERIRVDAITIGRRRRKALTGLLALARSIERHGLVHPILLRNGNELVAGQRRLEACRLLGWATIPARRVDELSDEALRALELDENTERMPLKDDELTQARLAAIQQAEAAAKARAVSAQPGPKLSRRGRRGEGRPKKAGSGRDVAEQAGIGRQEQDRIKRHAALLATFPFLRQPGWGQHSALEAGARLGRLPKAEYPGLASLLDQPGIPPKQALQILDNLGGMAPATRDALYTQAQSADAHERSKALTRAAQLPPPPDPGLLNASAAQDSLAKAARVTRLAQFRPELEALATTVAQLCDRMGEASRHHG